MRNATLSSNFYRKDLKWIQLANERFIGNMHGTDTNPRHFLLTLQFVLERVALDILCILHMTSTCM